MVVGVDTHCIRPHDHSYRFLLRKLEGYIGHDKMKFVEARNIMMNCNTPSIEQTSEAMFFFYGCSIFQSLKLIEFKTVSFLSLEKRFFECMAFKNVSFFE